MNEQKTVKPSTNYYNNREKTNGSIGTQCVQIVWLEL